ncbi:hypothetical protein AO735_08455 [Pseudomonas sp. TTU2014-096BSC]|uniref:carbon storage regulator n=1 Tax=Stutzerimonas nitrititolerans TaxID=2482751 RepID=UPI000718A5DC|nr:carbon storage regulator [Stutzerimonas nitrititolerans]KRW65132.1 hypothetical protein AO735_08455 [Pseudomonas sp. TTU2014-096BSC]SUD84730.1 carbon storage regulator [Stutzerimonas stutzeri]
MGRLIVTRSTNEQIRLTLKPGASVEDLLCELEDTGIWITMIETDGARARLAIDAPNQLLVLREELIADEQG